MPEMTIRLLEWMRQYDRSAVIMSRQSTTFPQPGSHSPRAYDYILKPFEKDQLFLGVGRALQHRRLIIENRNYQRNLEQLVEERTGSSPQSTWNSSSPTTTRSRPSKRPGT